MNKLRKIFKSTIFAPMSAALIVAFAFSIFLYFDFYKDITDKIKGYYFVYLGDKVLKKQDLQKAVEYYEKGIALHPKHYRAMYNLANIYVVYEDYYSALKNYEKALKVKPDYEMARIDYAIILSATYKTDLAIEEYKKVIKQKPKFVKIPFIKDSKKSFLYNKGVAYYNMGIAYRTKSLLAGLNEDLYEDYMKKATNSYKEAAKYLNSYNSNYNLALIYQLLKNKNQAGYFYCKAMEFAPLEYEAHFNYAILLNDLKEYDAAAIEFRKAGVLLDSKGDNVKTRYIYDVLSEVNEKIAMNADKELYKKLNKKEVMDLDLKYKAGKIYFEDKNKDKDTFFKDYKTCAKRNLFMGDE